MTRTQEMFQPTNSGDFLSQITPNPVQGEPVHLEPPVDIDGVMFEKRLFTLEDGQSYPVTTTRLPLGKRRTNVLLASSAAWTTRGKGFNRREQLFTARDLGMESFFVDTAHNLDRMSHIEEDARNHLAIANHIRDEGDYMPEALIATGTSHGGMNTLAIMALARKLDQDVWFGYSRGPCFPDHIAQTDIPRNIPKIINELGGIASILTTVPPRALRHYLHTLDLSPRAILRHARDVPTLLGGRVGELVYKQLPKDSFGYVSVRDGDVLSQAKDWEDTLHRHPLMLVDRRPGGSHLEECASETATKKWKGVMSAISNALAEHEDELAKIARRPGGSASIGLHYIVGDKQPSLFIEPFMSTDYTRAA